MAFLPRTGSRMQGDHMAWATVEEVLALTGQTVTAANLALGSGIISTYTGADEEVPEDAITPRDRRILQRATAWQAVWVTAKPGLISERESHAGSAADGVSVQRSTPSDVILAPLAAREIKNLSWVGTRTEFVPHLRTVPSCNPMAFLNESSDDCGVWESL